MPRCFLCFPGLVAVCRGGPSYSGAMCPLASTLLCCWLPSRLYCYVLPSCSLCVSPPLPSLLTFIPRSINMSTTSKTLFPSTHCSLPCLQKSLHFLYFLALAYGYVTVVFLRPYTVLPLSGILRTSHLSSVVVL